MKQGTRKSHRDQSPRSGIPESGNKLKVGYISIGSTPTQSAKFKLKLQ